MIALPMDIIEIQKYLPHRPPFLLIDRIIKLEPGKMAVAIKNVSVGEPYFQGHFPGQPIFPGVLLLEAMAQTAAVLTCVSLDISHQTHHVYLASVEKTKYRKLVTPGDILELHVESLRTRRHTSKIRGIARVDGALVAEMEFTAMFPPKTTPDRPVVRASPSQIHQTAIVEPGTKIGSGVTIGPYSTVGPNVEIADDVQLGAHTRVWGRTCLGRGVRVFPFAVLGEIPQDLKYVGEDTRLEIGEDSVIREHATVHIGTDGGGGVTRVGARCMLMGSTHVGHDCTIGDDVIITQGAAIAGHVQVDHHAFIGALVGVHQHCRIGRHAMVGAMSGVFEDLLPYGLCTGSHAALSGLNHRGLRRRGFERPVIQEIERAYAMLFSGEGVLSERADTLLAMSDASSEASVIAKFIQEQGSRPIMQPTARTLGRES